LEKTSPTNLYGAHSLFNTGRKSGFREKNGGGVSGKGRHRKDRPLLKTMVVLTEKGGEFRKTAISLFMHEKGWVMASSPEGNKKRELYRQPHQRGSG